jgi:isoquinoline 1-oxidoreductase beta subunit
MKIVSTHGYENHLRELAKEDGQLDKNIGNVDFAQLTNRKIRSKLLLYETPMVAHHPMEPMDCIAHVEGDKLELWTSSQVNSNANR